MNKRTGYFAFAIFVILSLILIWNMGSDMSETGVNSASIVLGSMGAVLISAFVGFLIYGSYLPEWKRVLATTIILLVAIITSFAIGNLEGIANYHIAMLLAILSSTVILISSMWNWNEVFSQHFPQEKRKNELGEISPNREDDKLSVLAVEVGIEESALELTENETKQRQNAAYKS